MIGFLAAFRYSGASARLLLSVMSIYKHRIWLIILAITIVFLALVRQTVHTNNSAEDAVPISRPEYFRASLLQWLSYDLWPLYRPAVQNVGPSHKADIHHSRVVVIPRMEGDDISWIEHELPNIDVSVHVADNSTATQHPPKNKGHEVMIYLTYIIDNYLALPDIMIFMHSHRWTHHNNALLDYDASWMIRRLSNAYVSRQGYVNMRCHWSPGCPEWLDPDHATPTAGKQEEAVLRQCWNELFPSHDLPKTLSQACCAQFAVSKQRIQMHPLSQYVFYRDWILRTPLSDYVSGRIWEYSWQYIFTGLEVSCPAEDVCYCGAFGVCFGGSNAYVTFMEQWRGKERLEAQLKSMEMQSTGKMPATQHNDSLQFLDSSASDAKHVGQLRAQVEALAKVLAAKVEDALNRGDHARQHLQDG